MIYKKLIKSSNASVSYQVLCLTLPYLHIEYLYFGVELYKIFIFPKKL